MRLPLALSLLLLSFPAQAAWQDEPGAKLRWLDKVTARTGVVELRNDESAKYGDLVIRVKSCRAQDPLEGADSAAFLQIWEAREREDPEWVYSGWMFASSPGIAAMDHPVYDVWVLGCLGRPNAPAQSTDAKAGELPTAEEADAAAAEEEKPAAQEEVIPDEAPTTTEEQTVEETPVEDGDAAPDTTEETVPDEAPVSDENAAPVNDIDAPYQPPAGEAPQGTSEPNWDAPFNGYTRPQ